MRPNKKGHRAPKGFRTNLFNSIEIEGDYHYCKSHNFVYNKEMEELKLFHGIPCYYTDAKFEEGDNNFYGSAKIYWTRWKGISLKACIRRVLNVKGIPVGTMINFNKSWYFVGKNIDNSYGFRINKENKIDFKYEVTKEAYINNIKNCIYSQTLVERLRKEGFLVSVYNSNPDALYGEHEGEIVIAYGYGKRIGFSTGKNSFRGYQNGCDNILYDYFGEFDKWSRCIEISKGKHIDEIIDILKKTNQNNMTSANVVEFSIYKGDKCVGYHRENVMCENHYEEFLKFQPLSEYTIIVYGYDEDDELWENEPENLEAFLRKKQCLNKKIKDYFKNIK